MPALCVLVGGAAACKAALHLDKIGVIVGRCVGFGNCNRVWFF